MSMDGHLNDRRGAVREWMAEEAVEALLVSAPPNVRWLTDFTGEGLLVLDETGALLEENRGLLTDDLLAALDGYVEQLGESDTEMAEHLKKVRGQIVAKRTILH